MGSAREPRLALIEIIEPDPADCPSMNLPPEGNVKLRNYRLLTENLRAYTPTGDVHTSPCKGKLVAKFDSSASISPPRARILELLRDEDPGREALEAIVRPAPRRLQRPLDEDSRRFLQRALLSPSPYLSPASSPEPSVRPPESSDSSSEPESLTPSNERTSISNAERSLAEELREAEEDAHTGGIPREILREFTQRDDTGQEAFERERLGKLALSVEEDETEAGGLSLAARRLDALLAESRALHDELAGIQRDLQVLARRLARREP
ncbi:Uncharacterized protein OBRU01_12618 [Operophtera brumata]|uniref:Uncharacterized protein n=1 Tax=Operophtera brumata TaxID=104452 RepID=A0A0L7L9R4_OPEBR|nr:Uncharacterized protein OBRU01_12618 [Operophtera brumata]